MPGTGPEAHPQHCGYQSRREAAVTVRQPQEDFLGHSWDEAPGSAMV